MLNNILGDQPTIPMPGSTEIPKQSLKQLLFSTEGFQKRGCVVASGQGVIKEGQVLGFITASGKAGRAFRTTASATATTAVATVVLTDLGDLKVGDTLVVGTNPARVVTAINAGTKTVTFGSNHTVAVSIGDVVKFNDGTDVAQVIALNEVDATSADRFINVALAGTFIENQLVGLTAELKKDLNARSITAYGAIKF